MMNRRGVMERIMMVLILAVVLAVIVSFVWLGSILLPILVGTGKDLASQVQSSISSNSPSQTELTNATAVGTTMVTNILGIVESVVYIVFIFMIVGFILLAYYVRTYPFLAWIWVFVIIALVFMSMFLSNSYIQASSNPLTQSYYTTWGTNDFLMNNLPTVLAVIGVFGGIFLFVLASREPESEVQQL